MAKKKNMETPDFEKVEPEEKTPETPKPEENKEPVDESVYDDPLLSGPTVNRDYSKVRTDEKLGEDIPHIEPPDFGQNTYNPEQDDEAEQVSGPAIEDEQSKSEPSDESKSSFESGDTSSPGMGELGKKEKRQGAEQLADLTLYVYEQLHEVGRNFGKVTDNKLTRKAARGDFDFSFMHIPIPLSDTDSSQFVTLRQFFDDINHMIDETIVVSEDFKEHVRPLLIEFFIAKGWGMTKENSLLMTILMDLAPKATTIISLKRYTAQMIETAAAYYQRMDESHKKTSQQEPPEPPPSREKKSQQTKKESQSSGSETPFEFLSRIEQEDKIAEPEEMNHE